MNDYSETKTALLQNEVYSIRVMTYTGKVMFALRDVLKACGISHPQRWISRAHNEVPCRLESEKLFYPMETASGWRQFQVWFVDAENATRVINATACGSETRQWLTNRVLTYRFDGNIPAQPKYLPKNSEKAVEIDDIEREPMVSAPQKTKYEKTPEANQSSDIGRKIDDIIYELLELKRKLVYAVT